MQTKYAVYYEPDNEILEVSYEAYCFALFIFDMRMKKHGYSKMLPLGAI